MKISDGIQRISYPEEVLTYVKPILNRTIVPPVDPIKQKDFSNLGQNLKFYGPEGASKTEESSSAKGRLVDFYV
ncbi:hypothetical protein LEP1GSC058_3392 [Leptospira fainei serovar Hurstbridge str. BUT 6]|uniref:Uncharacterized protein n=1 Tax=Leptospira fainei serovar Hurstbridge str. BUT 6 TaxID=1193011 RepID=S3UR60_9LEPT|nr:hypothetical protein [Leptospira fainei]EPG72886.1 hypothetical protein LEP1GSC058_3392 [Leptospira fainei serovar Hurstbridge str. BUT 6]